MPRKIKGSHVYNSQREVKRRESIDIGPCECGG